VQPPDNPTLNAAPTGAPGCDAAAVLFVGNPTMPSNKTGRRRRKDEQPPSTRATCKSCGHTVPIELAKAGKGKHANICK
jgi:hypothetical protein